MLYASIRSSSHFSFLSLSFLPGFSLPLSHFSISILQFRPPAPPPPPPSCHCFLCITVTPSIEPSNAAVVLSQSVTFVCAVEGTSDPLQLQWLRGTAQIVEDTRVQLTSNSLFISSVERDDEGNYTCRAIFTGGVTETVAFLDVLGE